MAPPFLEQTWDGWFVSGVLPVGWEESGFVPAGWQHSSCHMISQFARPVWAESSGAGFLTHSRMWVLTFSSILASFWT